jgi:hypothetical protein
LTADVEAEIKLIVTGESRVWTLKQAL